jgi:hypothetical protein
MQSERRTNGLGVLILVAAACLAGCVSSARAQADVEIPFLTGKTPTIDGDVDDIWALCPPLPVSIVIEGSSPISPADCSPTWQALCSPQYLYMLVDVQDESLIQDSSSGWDDDRVEVFIDGDNSKDSVQNTTALNDYQFNFRWNYGIVETPIEYYQGKTTGVEYAVLTTPTGYRVEIKLPWSTLTGKPAQLGQFIGIDVLVDDDDDGGSRDTQVSWHTPNSPPHDPRKWGTAVFASASIATAGNPNPADQATDVSRDVVLSWTPGRFAVAHDVYFGASFNDVNDASRGDTTGVLKSQAQEPNSLDPGRLQLGQTYYWRVDEVNAPPSGAIWKGGVWSFTVEPVSFAIPGSRITASASSTGRTDWGPEKTIDSSGLNANDQHSVTASDMWISASPATQPVWIQYAFDQPYLLDRMIVWNSNQSTENALGVGAKHVTIECGMDGETWTALGDFIFNRGTAKATYAANTQIDFGSIAAKYVKITIKDNWGNKLKQYSLSEVRFFSIPVAARLPYPASGATNVAPHVTLTWRAGRQAGSHQVYLSTDQQAVIDGNMAPITTLQPSYDATVDLIETYYWKVTEVNEAESPSTWNSDVWSFSTAAFVVVDNFEKYTSLSPDRVFQTWRDGTGFSADEFFPNGYAGNGTGSVVGYDPLSGDIMQTEIFHGGRNSMPFEYHNTAGVTTSEAVRTFDAAQDWTKSAIKTLVLYFYGSPTNAACQLYVKINNTKVAYSGEVANLQRARWSQCNIDLSAVPASSLQSVKTLTLGVENAGEGKLLFDDIGLYRTAPEIPVAVAPSTADLVAYYAMENNVQDSSGNGNDGTVVGAPTYTPGPAGYGTALQFNGTADCVDLGNKPAFNPSGSFSISLWANPTNWSTTEWGHVMVSNRGEGSVGWQIRRYSSSTTMCFTTRGTGSATEDVPSRSPMPVNEWVHIACVYNNADNTKRIYINGAEDAVAATTAGGSIVATTMNTYVAARANSGNTGPETFFAGSLDEIRIYNRALSAGEVEYLSNPTP